MLKLTQLEVKISLKSYLRKKYKTYYGTVKNKVASFKISILIREFINIKITSGNENYKINVEKSKITIIKVTTTVKAPKITLNLKSQNLQNNYEIQ